MSLPFKDSIQNGSVSLGFDVHRVEPGVTARTWLEKCLLIDALPRESTAWTDRYTPSDAGGASVHDAMIKALMCPALKSV